jgi:hypothetical protein
VRGQYVEDVEITVDTLGKDGAPRWFLRLIFRENPASGTPEEQLLQRVFSDIPKDCFCRAKDESEAVRIMRGRIGPVWYLEDEIAEAVKTIL